jgi:DNA primase
MKFEKLFGIKIEVNSSFSALMADIDQMNKNEPVQEHTVCSLPSTISVWDAPSAVQYLEGRGITENQITEYGIRYCGRGPYAHRIIIPVIDLDYSLCNFVARSVGSAGRKYLYATNRSLNGVLFGLYKYRRARSILLVEGVFDYFHVERAHPCAVSFGKHLSEQAVHTMKKTKVQNVGILWDADAMSEAVRTKKRFGKDFNFSVLPLPEGVKDPATLSERQLRGIISRWKRGDLL